MKPLLSGSNQQLTIPVSFWMVVWLFMDKFHAGAIWYGVYWTIVVLWLLILITGFLINVFKGRKTFMVDEDGNIHVK